MKRLSMAAVSLIALLAGPALAQQTTVIERNAVEAHNFDFMTAAIQSLVEPLSELAEGDFTPEWAASGRPEAR